MPIAIASACSAGSPRTSRSARPRAPSPTPSSAPNGTPRRRGPAARHRCRPMSRARRPPSPPPSARSKPRPPQPSRRQTTPPPPAPTPAGVAMPQLTILIAPPGVQPPPRFVPQLPRPTAPPGVRVRHLAQRHLVRTAHGHRHDQLAVETRRPGTRLGASCFSSCPAANIPKPKGVDATAFRQRRRVEPPADHHQHRLAVKHHPRHQRRRETSD